MASQSEVQAGNQKTPATLSPDEARATIQFLNRADIKGSESEAHAHIKFKLGLIMKGEPMPRPENVTDLEGVKGKGKI